MGPRSHRQSVLYVHLYLHDKQHFLPATLHNSSLFHSAPPLLRYYHTLLGIITFSTAFIKTWRQMIALRVLLGTIKPKTIDFCGPSASASTSIATGPPKIPVIRG
jgi:hypothetical protein